MKFTDIFVQRPVLATVVSLLILILGLRSIHDLSLRQFPKMENTVITITTAYPGASAELMQGFITAPLQKSIAGADGIDYLTAQSMQSVSTITANIKLNYNPDKAMAEIMAKVAEVRNALPKESDQPVIQKDTGDQMALMYLGFNSENMSTQQITDYISRVVQPKLQTVGGVASAEILGGQTYAMRIWLDTNRMAAFNLSTTDVVAALQSQNFQTAAGQIKGKYVLYNINAKTTLTDTNQFKNIVIINRNNTLVRIKDIATVELGAVNYDSSVIFNGKTAVFIGIKGTPTANPLTVISDVKKVLPELASSYPPGFQGKVVYDSTEYIRSSIHEVIRSISEASLIVVLVIFLFLGSLRTVIIPVITIPLSLIGVCTLMYMMDYSLNLLTLLAMVLAIGLVVDDAIVVVENIYRHIEAGLSPYEAAKKGAREIASPIISMTTTLAAVYAPIGFMTGITGALFKEFAFTLAFCVVISGVIALTLSPMMCSKMLSHSVSNLKFVQAIDQFFEKLKNIYQQRLSLVLQHKSVVAAFALIMILSCGLLAATTTTELAPQEDKSILFLSATAPEYANLNYLTQFTSQLNAIYESIPEAQDYFIVNGMGASNNAISGLMLKPWDKRHKSQSKLNGILQEKISHIAGLNIVSFPLPSIPGGSGLPIQFVVTSTADYVTLYNIMDKLKQSAEKSGLFLFVDSDLKFEKPELEITIDRNKAANMGISMQSIGSVLATVMSGGNVNRFSREGESYEVIPQVPDALRMDPEKINNLYVPAGDKHELIPLSTIVKLKMQAKPNALAQFQQLNSATLEGLMMPGKSISQGLAFLTQQAHATFPIGVSYDFAGESRQAEQEGATMLYTFIFALIIIYLVLAAQFESFKDPLIILVSVPLSVAGALLPLNIGFSTLNIYTEIGLVTLIGLISKHGILMVQFANQLQKLEGLSITESIIKSATLRLRPILMTTAAMVLGVLPLILANGAGAQSRFDIGLVIATGMLIGTCFTLFVVPTMYMFFAKDHQHG
ncbi:acriflavine resistance protein B [Gammaproteobacteria bacterium SCGC AG-212-F23]|nr:acriflavine resistance protein B [Gammaproteobacteria bacterium SCGC AG-212-F23]